MQGRDDRLRANKAAFRSQQLGHSSRLVDLHFQPAGWCPGAHAQTIYAHLYRPAPRISYQRRRLETPDGDFLDLDFLPGERNSPLVLILAGLEGNAWSKYVRSLVGEIQKIGWRACSMNYRGSSGEMNRKPETYHSGKTEDVEHVVNALMEVEYPRKIFVVGYSIGGNMMLKWLGEQGSKLRDKVERAIAVSVPYDLAQSVELMDRGFNREVYTRKLLTQLKWKAFWKLKQYPKLFNPWKLWFASKFSEFDDQITAKLNGFKDASDYWVRSSCTQFLSDIRVETGLIHSEDDPFFPGRLFPHDTVRRSEYLETIWTLHGGHLGFVTGSKAGAMEPWLEHTIIQYLSAKK